MAALSTLLTLTFFFLLSSAAPSWTALHRRRSLTLDVYHPKKTMTPALALDFPDPTVIEGHDGHWYAFATNSNGKNIQIARSTGPGPFSSWELLNIDALPNRSWTSGANTWAPDVKQLKDGSYIMYYSGAVPNSPQHCIGVARSTHITGPYKPDPQPWVCPKAQGGAIDASGFLDEATGKRYVVYKVDGNSRLPAKTCGEGVNDPTLKTPLMLQEVHVDDGSTKIGQPVKLMDRIPSVDGALIEAPEITRLADGTYILFFSSHCFNDPAYDIKYAWSKNVEGPYKRGGEALLKTPEFGLQGPGGVAAATMKGGHTFMAFHGYCQGKGRCFYMTQYGEP